MQILLNLIRKILSKEQRRLVKFCLVGASGVPVNLAFTWVGHHFLFTTWSNEWRKAGAFIFGIFISIFTNFLLNDFWTWRDREKASGNFFHRLLLFYFVCSLSSVIQFGTAMGLTLWMKLHYLLSQLVGIVLATALNFVANNAWTFRKKKPADADDPSKMKK